MLIKGNRMYTVTGLGTYYVGQWAEGPVRLFTHTQACSIHPWRYVRGDTRHSNQQQTPADNMCLSMYITMPAEKAEPYEALHSRGRGQIHNTAQLMRETYCLDHKLALHISLLGYCVI